MGMIPARIPGATRYLGAPAGWRPDEHGDCAHLAIRDMAVNGNVPTMQSLWEPTPQELDWLARGGKVRLGVGGTEHPLVFLMVDLPPDDQA
jgi:hypothetical protein